MGRCLYEILGVERDADDDVLKKAYRKQALIWHPGARRPIQTCESSSRARTRCRCTTQAAGARRPQSASAWAQRCLRRDSPYKKPAAALACCVCSSSCLVPLTSCAVDESMLQRQPAAAACSATAAAASAAEHVRRGPRSGPAAAARRGAASRMRHLATHRSAPLTRCARPAPPSAARRQERASGRGGARAVPGDF
jgi:hypothetical protein